MVVHAHVPEGSASHEAFQGFVCGVAFGLASPLAGHPLDTLKSRMQALPALARGGSWLALRQTVAEGGVRALWRGAAVNIARAATVTAAQLAAYDSAKCELLRRGGLAEGASLHAAASLVAGAAASAAVAPLDLAKSRVMAAAAAAAAGGGGGDAERSAVRVLARVLREEGGVRALMRGFTLAWLRLGPHTILSFTVYEKLRALAGLPPL